jgi:hypothetical protein
LKLDNYIVISYKKQILFLKTLYRFIRGGVVDLISLGNPRRGATYAAGAVRAFHPLRRISV